MDHVLAVLERSTAAGEERLVLLALAAWADGDGVAFPSSETLARVTLLPVERVQTALIRLVLAGELEPGVSSPRCGTWPYRIVL